MTGRIEVSATARQPGRITTRTGASTFEYAYLLAPGGARLRVGRLVSFELERGTANAAVKVRGIDRETLFLGGPDGPPEVRYYGFDQKNDVRSFKFRAWRTGQENQEVIVSADLALFRKHGITVQEGPALCLRFVQAELQQPGFSGTTRWERALTEEEVVAHMAQRQSSSRKRS